MRNQKIKQNLMFFTNIITKPKNLHQFLQTEQNCILNF